MLSTSDFFDLTGTEFADLFDGTSYVWEAIAKIEEYIRYRFEQGLQPTKYEVLGLHSSVTLGPYNIYVGEGTIIEPSVTIMGPAIIGRNCEIRQGAYLRENVILGDNVVVGHASELKNAVMLNHSHAPHFAYLGDSILGRNVNLGAGTKLSNLTLTSQSDPLIGLHPTIKLQIEGVTYDTGLSKFGAILGDDVQLGCNCVTNPGCLVGVGTLVYALVSLKKGYYPPKSIIKLRQDVEVISQQS